MLSPVLFSPDVPANLVSVDQVLTTGGKCHFGPARTDNYVSFDSPEGQTRLEIEKVNGIHAFVCDMPDDLEEESDDEEDERGPTLAWMGDTSSPELSLN